MIRERTSPTQSCVLTHVTNTDPAIEQGAPVDLVFQSIAGTEAANRSFGIWRCWRSARGGPGAGRGTLGDNVMYFETGQGSALSANAHHGVDQQTCEARAYGVARLRAPLVNTVVGFIGPEYLYDGKQIIRAGWRTTSAASCWACPWAATSATPTTPRPTRTTWTRC
jgi:ethanolamine ammonia-lyase large subunit